MMNPSTKDIIRFWMKVKITSPEKCWNWIASIDEWGYGCFGIGGKTYLSHRVAFVISNRRQIKDGMLICHSCDNPACCNPRHLWEGTNKDNADDRDKKGRLNPQKGLKNGAHTKPEKRVRGETHGSAKWDDRTIDEIRYLLSLKNRTQRSIARQYDMSDSHISAIAKNKIRKSPTIPTLSHI